MARTYFALGRLVDVKKLMLKSLDIGYDLILL